MPATSAVERALLEALGEALAAAHPRRGRIIDAISQVLIGERDPMQARDVHVRVEALLGEPVRWSSVKATLAGNLNGQAPRFVRVARGRYGVPSRAQASESRSATRETRGWPRGSWARRTPR